MLHDLGFRLQKREEQGNLRNLSSLDNLIDFASNDYLGLAKSAFFAAEISHAPIGSSGSRLLTGNSGYVENLEAKIAAFHGFEAGLIYNCGFMANLGLISAIANETDLILYDTQIHASTRLGIRLSKGKSLPFRHNDVEHLEDRIKKNVKNGFCYVCIESIYSTDGSMAPLSEIIAICRQYQARLIVDEAHAVGLWGPQGRGVVALHASQNDIFCQIVTFGKALGGMGAIILGSDILRKTLINFSIPFIYTTAPSFPQLAAIRASYRIFPEMESERLKLRELIKLFQNHFKTISETAIQSLPINDIKKAKMMAIKCRKAGFDVRALTSPTVRKGEELLRIVLHTFNTPSEIESLKELLL